MLHAMLMKTDKSLKYNAWVYMHRNSTIVGIFGRPIRQLSLLQR